VLLHPIRVPIRGLPIREEPIPGLPMRPSAEPQVRASAALDLEQSGAWRLAAGRPLVAESAP
jgi:hypothetical protein